MDSSRLILCCTIHRHLCCRKHEVVVFYFITHIHLNPSLVSSTSLRDLLYPTATVTTSLASSTSRRWFLRLLLSPLSLRNLSLFKRKLEAVVSTILRHHLRCENVNRSWGFLTSTAATSSLPPSQVGGGFGFYAASSLLPCENMI